MLQDGGGQVRVVAVNKDSHAQIMRIAAKQHGLARISLLRAPSLAAANGVSWEGQSFAADGRLHGRKQSIHVRTKGGIYQVKIPAGSAALISLPKR
jgi:hypothetical protein